MFSKEEIEDLASATIRAVVICHGNSETRKQDVVEAITLWLKRKEDEQTRSTL